MYRAAASLASKARAASSSGRMIGSRLAWSRNYAAKDIRFGVEARPLMLRSVQELADAVKVTMGPKILGYEKTFPRCFSVSAQGGPASQPSIAEKKTVQEVGKVVSGVEGKVVVEPASHVDGKKVTCFSPLEAISIKPRTGSLVNESLKIKRTELSQKLTFALIPALLLISKTSLTTSILVLSVYWQIHGYFKEIFLDYVHQEVTLKWVMVYFNILLLILVKDTFLDFGLV